MIAPVLLFLMMAIIEVSLVMFVQNVMENATFVASRLGKTGFVEESSTQQETVIRLMEERVGDILDSDQIEIATFSYSRFDQVGEPEPYIDANGNHVRDEGENYTDINGNSQYDTDMGTEGLGNAGEIVVYTVSYPWRIMTPLMDGLLGENGVMTISARAVVQNEPY